MYAQLLISGGGDDSAVAKGKLRQIMAGITDGVLRSGMVSYGMHLESVCRVYEC